MSLYATIFANTFRRAAVSPRACRAAPAGLSSLFLKPAQVWQRPLSVQFALSKAWGATHRSRLATARPRDPWSPPPPQGPWQRFKQWLDSIPSNTIFWGVLGINAAVFAAWQLSRALYQSSGDASLFLKLQRNFTVSMQNISAGRIWTLLTASFSHEGVMHIFTNAFTFYFMAPPVLQLLGNSGFLALYLGGGIFCSLASLWWNNSVKHRSMYSSHGASGAVYAVISFFACVAPKAQFALFGILPIPAWAFVTGVFLMDGYESLSDSRTRVDNAGHIGGILAGIGYFLGKRFRVF
ncbi:rhomboid-domain-containing protein [Phanerochaete sordida]|uniref:Rhomboid-domain-containing protein n=1 Tax=Phanerochaete sordida TaxID=48140 RepID=A0A9P3FYG7_9APHY|nr:rhomboid-domain-containing protein [Phanerochaete sordida]